MIKKCYSQPVMEIPRPELHIERSSPGIAYAIDYCEHMPTQVELAQYIIKFAENGGELTIGVRDGIMYGLPVVDTLDEWQSSIRQKIQDATNLLNPVFTDDIGIDFGYISGTPRAEVQRRSNSRPRVSSSPRNIKKAMRYTVHLTFMGNHTKYSLMHSIKPSGIKPNSTKSLVNELRKENNDLRSKLRAAEDRLAELETRIQKITLDEQ